MRNTPDITERTAEDNVVRKDALIFEAFGATYLLRKLFSTWAWFWDQDHKRWLNLYAGETTHPSIEAIKKFPEITIRSWQYGSKDTTETEVTSNG